MDVNGEIQRVDNYVIPDNPTAVEGELATFQKTQQEFLGQSRYIQYPSNKN